MTDEVDVELELTSARDADEKTLAAVDEIYRAAFPEELRAPLSDLLQDDTLVLTADGTPVGLAVLRRLAGTGWVFLRYLAIRDRGRGLGSRMWPLLLARCAADGQSRIVLDVEHPDEPGTDPAERALRERRIVFYQRLGVRLLPVSDYRPPHDGHPLPMRLLAAGTASPEAAPTSEDDVRETVLAVYRLRYGLPADDPIVQRTLQASGLLL